MSAERDTYGHDPANRDDAGRPDWHVTAPEPTPYTPTDADVRDEYVEGGVGYDDRIAQREDLIRAERAAEFDRWLAGVRAEARRDALNEAADAYTDYEGDRGAAMVVRRWLRALAAETPDGGA